MKSGVARRVFFLVDRRALAAARVTWRRATSVRLAGRPDAAVGGLPLRSAGLSGDRPSPARAGWARGVKLGG